MPNNIEIRLTGKSCFSYAIDLYYVTLETKSIIIQQTIFGS
jgi:hypothetical protein